MRAYLLLIDAHPAEMVKALRDLTNRENVEEPPTLLAM